MKFQYLDGNRPQLKTFNQKHARRKKRNVYSGAE